MCIRDRQQVALTGCIVEGNKRTVREEKLDIITSENNRRSETNRLIRRFAYDLLVEHKGYSINSYGILTGMRPVKLAHLLLDQGMRPAQINRQLKDNFRMSPDKADLIMEVAANEYPHLVRGQESQDTVGLLSLIHI